MKTKNHPPSNPSPILQAIMQNSKYTNQEADAIQENLEKQKEQNAIKAISQLSRSQSISDYLTIPSKIKPEDINQTHQTHPHFKNYDHSLEMPRSGKLGIKSKDGVINEDGEVEYDDGITMGNLGSQDV